MLWCHSHLVSLAFILKTLCDLFLLLFCLYCCVGIVREKRGGMPSGRKNFEVENFLANFAVLWLFTKVFSAKFVVARQKPEGFLRENRIFHQFAKVSLSKVSRYTVELFVYIKHSPLFQMLPSEIVKPNITLLYLGLINPHSLVEYHSPKNSVDCHHKGHIVLSRKTPLQPGFFRITFVG